MGFILPPPTPTGWALIPDGHDYSNAGANPLVANAVYYSNVTVRAKTPLIGFRPRFGVAGNGHYDIGVYDVNGNQLTHLGSTLSATGKQSPALASVYQVNPGMYYFAYTIDNATDTPYTAGISNFLNMDAQGTYTGGLPANLSSLTGVTTGTRVAMVGLIQGGWS